jgi:hypothetical protein
LEMATFAPVDVVLDGLCFETQNVVELESTLDRARLASSGCSSNHEGAWVAVGS